MSLNGTLETFALPDVLALLAATRKSGELKVEGGRGDSRLWLDKGEMVGADVPRATTFADAIFEMLRLTKGNFTFDNDGKASDPSDPVALEPLVQEAQSRLGEWRSIEAVVPSPACAVSLSPEVSGGQVSISREQWRALVAVAASRDVEGVVRSLGLGEFTTCRILKDLVQTGLVSIGDRLPAATPEPAPAPAPARAPEPASADAPAARQAAAASAGGPTRPVNPAAMVAAARAGATPPAPARPAVAGARVPAAGAASPAPAPTPAPDAAARPSRRISAVLEGDSAPPAPAAANRQPAPAAPAAKGARPPAAAAAAGPAAKNAPAPEARGDDDRGALVHQLAQLQGAAKPPAPRHATAGSSATEPPAPKPDTEAGEASAEPEKEEEPLNRGLLLKFLNSVRS